VLAHSSSTRPAGPYALHLQRPRGMCYQAQGVARHYTRGSYAGYWGIWVISVFSRSVATVLEFIPRAEALVIPTLDLTGFRHNSRNPQNRQYPRPNSPDWPPSPAVFGPDFGGFWTFGILGIRAFWKLGILESSPKTAESTRAREVGEGARLAAYTPSLHHTTSTHRTRTRSTQQHYNDRARRGEIMTTSARNTKSTNTAWLG
jgi:hypothetical protein